MRIYISVDMEGASGVTRWEDVVTRGQDYQRARSWMTGDVNAAVAGARAAGATEFVVEENHGIEMLCNLVLDEIDPDVDVVRGLPRNGPTTAAVLDDSYDAMFLVAHHAKVGDYPGYCAHTISYGTYADVRLEGRTVSEGEIFASIAAQHGVPTALVTGDDMIPGQLSHVADGHQLDEPYVPRMIHCETRHRLDLVVVDAAHDDHVQLDRREASVLRGAGRAHRIEAKVASCDAGDPFGAQAVDAHVDAIQSGFAQKWCNLRQANAVRRQRDVGDLRNRA